MFVWKIDASGLSVRLNPKPKDATHTNPGEIAEDTRDTEQPIAPQEKKATQNNTDKTNRKKDVAGQILVYLTDRDTSATTGEMRDALDCTHTSLNNALKQLVKSKQVRKVRRGVYKISVMFERHEADTNHFQSDQSTSFSCCLPVRAFLNAPF